MSCYITLCTITIILLLSLETISSARTLEGEKWLVKKKNILLLQSLQRGPVKPSQRNPCSTVPGRSKGRCTLAEIHVVGHLIRAPPVFADDIPKERLQTG